eukprot:3576279-Pleurochrysis_carterae.AAC.1
MHFHTLHQEYLSIRALRKSRLSVVHPIELAFLKLELMAWSVRFARPPSRFMHARRADTSYHAPVGARAQASGGAPGFFAVRRDAAARTLTALPLSHWREWWRAEGGAANAGHTDNTDSTGDSHKKRNTDQVDKVTPFGQVWLGYCDPSTGAGAAGWPLRNLLALIAHEAATRDGTDALPSSEAAAEGSAEGAAEGAASSGAVGAALETAFPPVTVSVLAFRESAGAEGGSQMLRVRLSADLLNSVGVAVAHGTRPPAVGWERNSANKLGPRLMDLSSQLDPIALATASVRPQRRAHARTRERGRARTRTRRLCGARTHRWWQGFHACATRHLVHFLQGLTD